MLAASDLVLGRSGGSIFEVTAAGRPAILVPYPHATADHQSANAAWMERAGAATVLRGLRARRRGGAERLRTEVAAILGDGARLEAMAAASRSLAKPDAARRIADEVLAAAIRPQLFHGLRTKRRRAWAGLRAGCTSSASAAPG